MIHITVISATYNRAELLDNALYTYWKQNFDEVSWEYILVDDMSTDNTKEIVEKWQSKIPLVYMTSEDLGLPKDPSVWRDGCPLINRASTFAKGKFLILTHPEIMIPPDALIVMYAQALRQSALDKNRRCWITAIPYWMPYGKFPKGWKTDLDKIRTMKGFYDPSWPNEQAVPMTIDYRNQNQEVRETWESWVFNGMWMKDWRWFGGFQEFTQWGSVDIDQSNRRRIAHVETVFAVSPLSPHKRSYLMVYHQNHESKRDGKLAMQGVHGKNYSDVESARKAGGLYQIYYHGPRERANQPGTLQGILGDHVSRYEFAAQFAYGKVIMDLPCGTGYSSLIMSKADPSSYTGIDIDTESIEYAQEYYGGIPGVSFLVGDMLDFPKMTQLVDLFLCFEGIEHIQDKKKFVDQMYSVLREGGTFIISTPNPAKAHGTAWDRYMISPQELHSLFDDGRWVNLDWFHQEAYSIDKVKVKPGMSEQAQIIILGGTKCKV